MNDSELWRIKQEDTEELRADPEPCRITQENTEEQRDDPEPCRITQEDTEEQRDDPEPCRIKQENTEEQRDSSDEDVQDAASEDTSETDEDSESGDDPEQDQDPIGTDEETSDEEDNHEEDNDEETDTYLSKNGSICWTSSPPRAKYSRRAPQITPGITKFAWSYAEDIKSTFELFLTEEIQVIVLEMTNAEGRRVYANEWTDLDLADIQAYIGVVILAGVYRSKNEDMQSLWHPEFGRPIFGAVMPLKTFRKISGVIRFDDKQTRNARRADDKLAAIRVVWNKWVERLPMMFNPGPNVTVEECLVPFRGRCPFKQYIPNKPEKYGIKIWAACDSETSYAWQMQVYAGKSARGQPEKNQGTRFVLDVTDGLRGHTIFCDSRFTSHALSQELLKRRITMVGTIRKNEPELPPALLAVKDRARYSSMFAFTETHSLVSYCPRKRKNLLLLSTLHRNASVSGRDDKMPQIILDYNKSKGGVDNLEKMVATYSCKRKTACWPLVLFYYVLDVSALNAHVLWSKISPEWHSGKSNRRRLFLEELGKALVAPVMEKRRHLPRAPASLSFLKKAKRSLEVENEASTSHAEATPKKKMRCFLCSRTQDRKTTVKCQTCSNPVCGSHVVYCCLHCTAT